MLVPLMQALVFGVLFGTSFTLYLSWRRIVPAWPTVVPIILVVTAISWVIASNRSQSTMWNIERVVGRDINGDGSVGRPVDIRLLPVNPAQGTAVAAAEAEDELRQQFESFVRACEYGTASRHWEARIGRDRFNEWRDLLIKEGYARWRKPGEP
ncbi:MAG: hypothetical protein ABIG63_09060, partial [Chloroflexota bacterium]